MADRPVTPRAYVRLLRANRNFRLLWCAQVVSEIGDWFYSVAIYSLLLEITGSAQAVALAFVLQVLPQALAAPAAGVLNDRISRKTVMILSDWSRAFITLAMVFAQSGGTLWLLYLLLFLETIFWALFEPAHHAVIPNIAEPGDETLVANSLSAITWAVTLSIGSALGGVVAAVAGRNVVFVVNALSFAVSALLIRQMRFVEPHLAGTAPVRVKDLGDFSPVVEGIQYVRRDPRLLATMLVKTGISFMGANWVLLPIFGERIFPLHPPGFAAASAGMLGMSLLLGARGLGALIGPMIATHWSGTDERRYRTGIRVAFLAGATGYAALSVAPTLPLALLAIVVAHSGGSIAWVFSTTMLQANTEDRYRGRVFSAEFALSMATLSAVSYTAGWLYDHGWSVRVLAAMTGALVLVPAVAWAAAQRLWRFER